jgi:hypothetical protein
VPLDKTCARALTPADVEAVAQRVVELLGERQAVTPRYLTAAQVAATYALSRPWVYSHAALLGGQRLPSGGARPRLRFEAAKVEQALATGCRNRGSQVAESRTGKRDPTRRRQQPTGTSGHLLPIRSGVRPERPSPEHLNTPNSEAA